ncbi:glycosyltransferase [Thalassotalea ganghwensis]
MEKKTKVLQVIPSLALGGISSVVMSWFRHIDREKYQFDFIVFNDGPLAKEIIKLGGRIYYIPTLKNDPKRYLTLLSDVFSKNSYDVIHVHNSFKNGVMLWLAKRAGIPVRVCHSHTSGLEAKWLAPLFKLLKWVTLSNSTNYVACGKEAGRFLFGNYDYQLIPNAINVEAFQLPSSDKLELRKRFGLTINKTLIGHVGRFSTVKNHQFLVQLAKHPSLPENVEIVCIGDGPLKTEIQSVIEQENLSERITLLPTSAEIPLLLQSLDAFIMPSLFEGVSVALLEAQASGLPCLVSDTVAKEVDMGFGALRFLSLQDQAQWISQLQSLQPLSADCQQIKEAFDTKGYSIDSVINQLTKLYGVEQ